MTKPAFLFSLLAFTVGLFAAALLFPDLAFTRSALLVTFPVLVLASGMRYLQHKQKEEFDQTIARMLQLLEDTGSENWEARVKKEIPEGPLAELFLRIGKNQQESRQFTQNATHELQTPLAIMKGNVEMMLQLPSLGEKEAKALSVILQNINRLSKIISALILLSKIENQRFVDDTVIALGEVVHTNLEHFKDMIQLQGLHVEVKKEGDFTTRMSATLAEIMVANLLQNAIRHNLPDGFIHIEEQSGRITFKNPGKPLKTDAENLFRRFYRDSEVEESLGLGLSIVRKIAEQYQLGIEYVYQDGVHSISLSRQ